MTKVVCNSSPIIALSIIKRLDLLWKVFDEIYITEEVYKEIAIDEKINKIGAKELKIRSVIIDDRSARHFAEAMLLKTIGIIGILLLAKNYKKIESVKAYLDILIENGFRISLKLYNQVLNSAGELD